MLPDEQLTLALINGNENLARIAIANGADKQREWYEGGTWLHAAALISRNLSPVFLQLLVEAGVDPQAKDVNMESAGELAYRVGNYSFCKNILELDDSPKRDASQYGILMHIAASQNQVFDIERLCTSGVDVNSRDTAGETPLHKAARLGASDAIRCLIEHGGDPRMRSNNGQLPLDVTESLRVKTLLNRFRPSEGRAVHLGNKPTQNHLR